MLYQRSKSLYICRDDDSNDMIRAERQKLRHKRTEWKMEKRHSKMMKKMTNTSKKLKPEYKDLPPLLPLSIPDVSETCINFFRLFYCANVSLLYYRILEIRLNANTI